MKKNAMTPTNSHDTVTSWQPGLPQPRGRASQRRIRAARNFHGERMLHVPTQMLTMNDDRPANTILGLQRVTVRVRRNHLV